MTSSTKEYRSGATYPRCYRISPGRCRVARGRHDTRSWEMRSFTAGDVRSPLGMHTLTPTPASLVRDATASPKSWICDTAAQVQIMISSIDRPMAINRTIFEDIVYRFVLIESIT